jgi:outer membrane protein assembly factor BamE
MLRRLLITAALTSLLAFAGCVYVPSVTQGNYLKYSDLQQLKVGMTRDQVKFLFGPPQLANPFYPGTWHYVYYFKRGARSKQHIYRLTVNFDHGKVANFKTSEPIGQAPDAPDTAAKTPAPAPGTLPRHPIGQKHGELPHPSSGQGNGGNG